MRINNGQIFSEFHPSDLAAEKKGDRELGKNKSMLLPKISLGCSIDSVYIDFNRLSLQVTVL